MEKGLRNGQMVVDILDNGRKTKHKDKGNYYILMETTMKGSGSKTKHKGKANTFIPMEHNMKESGWVISNMDME